MAPRHWTILIVPPGTGATRSIRIGSRSRRALLGGAVTAVLLVASSVAILFSPYATPSERILLAQNARLLAGLPTEPASSVTEEPPGADSADARGDVPDAPSVKSLAGVDEGTTRAQAAIAHDTTATATVT